MAGSESFQISVARSRTATSPSGVARRASKSRWNSIGSSIHALLVSVIARPLKAGFSGATSMFAARVDTRADAAEAIG